MSAGFVSKLAFGPRGLRWFMNLWPPFRGAGSLFSMADPFFMILMMRSLGDRYVVWDKAGQIRFIKPGKGTITASFETTQAMVDEAIAKTEDGEKFEPTYGVDLVNGEGETIARVEKTLHIRKKK